MEQIQSQSLGYLHYSKKPKQGLSVHVPQLHFISAKLHKRKSDIDQYFKASCSLDLLSLALFDTLNMKQIQRTSIGTSICKCKYQNKTKEPEHVDLSVYLPLSPPTSSCIIENKKQKPNRKKFLSKWVLSKVEFKRIQY